MGRRRDAFDARRDLDALDPGHDLVQGRGHELVHRLGLGAFDVMRRPAVAAQQVVELLARDAGQHRRVGDLIAVEMQDGQDGAVGRRVEEFVRVPARRQGACLGFAVADDAADEEVRVVEGRAEGVRQGVAQLSALVDRARGLRRDVARDAAGERELPEQPLQPVFVLGDGVIDLAVGPLEVGVGDEPGTAVAGTGDEDRVEVELFDDPVHVEIDEVEAGRRAPVAEEARLDVLELERFLEEGVRKEVDLADREVVRGLPPGIHSFEDVGRQRMDHCPAPNSRSSRIPSG